LFVLTLAAALSLSACYKNAGENLEPTSNRVELDDLGPTLTPTAGDADGVSPTPSTQPLQATPTAGGLGVPPDASAPTPDDALPDILPTRAEPTATSSGPTITTPSMSDIIPTAAPTATIDPTLLPSPTALPPGADPCAVVIASGDTLMTIARENEVTVEGLVAANPSVLTAGEFTTLQIGWELRLPDCGTPVAPVAAPEDPAAQPAAPAGASGPTVHIVQAGDTVYSLGRQYGVDPQAIINANSLVNPNALSVGQQLTIPAP
jgi:5'-nucleotidase